MNTDQYGRVEFTEQEAFAALYSGKISSLEDLHINDTAVIDQYNSARDTNADRIPVLEKLQEIDIPIEAWDRLNQESWFMPEEYKNMDIESFIVEHCPEQNYSRVVEELTLFHQHNMMDLLRYLKYLVDTLRANNVLWGVGRGSSVASYCLYILGVHKVDSIKYELDIREFLK
jgi:DNA polymerase III alpha subunit